MTISVKIEQVSRRLYVVGNTFPIKSQLKSLGCNWDADRKQWWIGSGKRAALEAIVAKLDGAQFRESLDEKPVAGKVEYKGKTYYVIGRSDKTGTVRLRLTVLDAAIDFWVDESACKWTKRYQSEQTLSGLRDFIKSAKSREKEGLPATRDWPGKECPCCESEPLDEQLYCWECGYRGSH